MPVLDHVVAVGSSQSGRMVRDFVYQGFNEDTDGRRVFDGMTPYVAGARRTFVNARFAQTGRYTRQHEDHNYPMDEFPFTFATTTDPLTGKTDGLLAACTASSTCPNIIQVDADSEYYGAHASLILTDTTGQPLELPPNVRYWMLATAHLQGNAGCRDPANPVQPWPYYRAAFDAMVQWVRDGVEPPSTRAPSVADGTAVTVEKQGEQYPTIPDRPYNGCDQRARRARLLRLAAQGERGAVPAVRAEPRRRRQSDGGRHGAGGRGPALHDGQGHSRGRLRRR